MSDKEYRLVWSSDSGDLRKKKQTGQRVRSLPPDQQTAYLHRDTKGRGGKGMTLIKNLVLSEEALTALARRIKQACGSGGTVRDGVIEIQGRDRERIAEILVNLGYKVKMAGG